jgi:hydroxymethylpyrimidine/phosphomethylpyrimidine kinase
LVQL